MLRKTMALPPAEQGAYFRKLRAEYRTRREFAHRIVELSTDQATARDLLGKLGFSVEVRETV